MSRVAEDGGKVSQSLAACKRARGGLWHPPCVPCCPVMRWLSWDILATDMSSEPLFKNLNSRGVVTSSNWAWASIYLRGVTLEQRTHTVEIHL